MPGRLRQDVAYHMGLQCYLLSNTTTCSLTEDVVVFQRSDSTVLVHLCATGAKEDCSMNADSKDNPV